MTKTWTMSRFIASAANAGFEWLDFDRCLRRIEISYCTSKRKVSVANER